LTGSGSHRYSYGGVRGRIDQLITNAIDAHVQGKQGKGGDDEGGAAGVLVPAG
jgi:hypothetical protein